MTTCCVAGYRPLRDIRPDEATWPPVLAPAGPWEICDCAEGDVARRVRGERSVTVYKTQSVGRTGDPVLIVPPRCSTCADAIPAAPIKWGENWSAHMCRMCGALLAEEKP